MSLDDYRQAVEKLKPTPGLEDRTLERILSKNPNDLLHEDNRCETSSRATGPMKRRLALPRTIGIAACIVGLLFASVLVFPFAEEGISTREDVPLQSSSAQPQANEDRSDAAAPSEVPSLYLSSGASSSNNENFVPLEAILSLPQRAVPEGGISLSFDNPAIRLRTSSAGDSSTSGAEDVLIFDDSASDVHFEILVDTAPDSSFATGSESTEGNSPISAEQRALDILSSSTLSVANLEDETIAHYRLTQPKMGQQQLAAID